MRVIPCPTDVWDNIRVKDSSDKICQRLSDKSAPSRSGVVANIETTPVSGGGIEARFGR